MKVFATVLSILVYLPIWFYLIYQILVRVEASELMWFLFWIYIPTGIISTLLTRLSDDKK